MAKTKFEIFDLTVDQATQAVGSRRILDQLIKSSRPLIGHKLRTGAEMHFTKPRGELTILLRGTRKQIRASKQALAKGENLIKK